MCCVALADRIVTSCDVRLVQCLPSFSALPVLDGRAKAVSLMSPSIDPFESTTETPNAIVNAPALTCIYFKPDRWLVASCSSSFWSSLRTAPEQVAVGLLHKRQPQVNHPTMHRGWCFVGGDLDWCAQVCLDQRRMPRLPRFGKIVHWCCLCLL